MNGLRVRYDLAATLKNDDGLPVCYDPESMTFEQQRAALETVYTALYPWHNTEEAKSYDYPTFDQAVREWAKDQFYIQHLTAKLYCETVDWMFEDPINVWQFNEE